MDLQQILHSKQAGLWALRISRAIPPAVGFRLADIIGGWIASNPDLPVARSIRLNRFVVSGETMNASDLDKSVRMTFRHLARSFYLLFHRAQKPDLLQKDVLFSERMDSLIAASKEKRAGVMIAGLHMSYFDLALQATAYRGMKVLTVSLPEETEYHDAIEWQHELRRESGLEILPASFKTLRTAIRRLEEGGTVVTGIDRPVDSQKYRPIFFNQPASLPVHHIFMALEAKVPVVLLAAIRNQDGRYQIHATPDIKMRDFDDRERALLYNAEKVLEAAQEFIRLAPEQWSVLLPVWPDLEGDIPY